jgi:hypothetical protein
MSVGKYSPLCPHADEPGWDAFKFNCYGEVPAEWSQEIADSGVGYDEKTMFDNYDDEGFDSYGYSCFDADGNYVGVGDGIDRYGYTEMNYLIDSSNGGDLYYDIQSYGGGSRMTSFVRNR